MQNNMNFPPKLGKIMEKIQYEPNYESFVYKGYYCVVRRMVKPFAFFGSLNGYVFVPKGHKFWDKQDFLEDRIECHGGITWSSEAKVLFPQIEDMWVYGFDTGHCDDVQPFMTLGMMYSTVRNSSEYLLNRPEAEYRDWEYVKKECESIVDQMIKLDNVEKES